MPHSLRTALVAVSVVLAAPAPAQDQPSVVSTDYVERRAVSETVPVFAQVVATRESDVAARVSGVVSEVPVRVGDLVAAGDPLVLLDTEVLMLTLRGAEAAEAEARAGIAVARAGVALAESGFRRAEGLQGTTAFSRGQFEDREGELARAQGEMARARAGLVRAEADLARARYDLDRARVTAPFDGVVLELGTDPGEYIQTGSPVARVIDTTDIEVEANVPAQYVENLAAGQRIEALSDMGAPFDLTVRAVLPTEFSATRTRPVRFETHGENGVNLAAIGQSLRIQVPIAEGREMLLVPKDALIQSRGAWQAFVAEDGKALPREVTIGASFGESFEVIAGLAEGDEVVVRGNERLRPMQDIAPNPVRPAPGTAQEGTRNPAEGGSPREQAVVSRQ